MMGGVGGLAKPTDPEARTGLFRRPDPTAFRLAARRTTGSRKPDGLADGANQPLPPQPDDTFRASPAPGPEPMAPNHRPLPTTLQEDRVMDFRPLAEAERRQLLTALRGNADRGLALLLDRRDTSFTGTTEDLPDEQVLTAVKSVPSHY
jgi:hypothetical protein